MVLGGQCGWQQPDIPEIDRGISERAGNCNTHGLHVMRRDGEDQLSGNMLVEEIGDVEFRHVLVTDIDITGQRCAASLKRAAFVRKDAEDACA